MAAKDQGNWYSNGILKIGDQTIDFLNDTIKVLVVNESHTFDHTHTIVNNVVTNEVSGTGYERKTLTSKAIENTSNQSVSSITRSGSTATVTTAAAHMAKAGDIIFIDEADQAEYNGYHEVTAVTSSTEFTYEVSGTPATPATGTIVYNALQTLFKAADLTYTEIDTDPDKLANAIIYKEVTDDTDSLVINQPKNPTIETIGTNIELRWPDGSSGVGVVARLKNSVLT